MIARKFNDVVSWGDARLPVTLCKISSSLSKNAKRPAKAGYHGAAGLWEVTKFLCHWNVVISGGTLEWGSMVGKISDWPPIPIGRHCIDHCHGWARREATENRNIDITRVSKILYLRFDSFGYFFEWLRWESSPLLWYGSLTVNLPRNWDVPGCGVPGDFQCSSGKVGVSSNRELRQGLLFEPCFLMRETTVVLSNLIIIAVFCGGLIAWRHLVTARYSNALMWYFSSAGDHVPPTLCPWEKADPTQNLNRCSKWWTVEEEVRLEWVLRASAPESTTEVVAEIPPLEELSLSG